MRDATQPFAWPSDAAVDDARDIGELRDLPDVGVARAHLRRRIASW
jgi:hypothetical protein